MVSGGGDMSDLSRATRLVLDAETTLGMKKFCCFIARLKIKKIAHMNCILMELSCHFDRQVEVKHLLTSIQFMNTKVDTALSVLHNSKALKSRSSLNI
jgi:hypothetical protein